LYILLLLILGKIKYFEKSQNFCTFNKGTVLGWALWSANTFPMCNRLPDPNSGFLQTLLFFDGFP